MIDEINSTKVLDKVIKDVELEKYFTKIKQEGMFSGLLLAQDVLQKIKIVTLRDTQDMYFYDENEGIWRPNAETKIHEIVKEFLGEYLKTHYLNETLTAVKALTYIDRKTFESAPIHLIPVANGVLNLKTKELLPFSEEYFFTFKLPVEYKPGVDCPEIKKFLKEITSHEDDAELLVEFAAYCLWRDYPIHKAFMLVGDGSNGKSTFLQLLEKFLGKDNVSSISLHDIENNRFATYGLYRKLANIYADLPSISLTNSGKFKMLTGGDTIRFEKKFKDEFYGKNYTKLIFSANRIPFAKDDSEAYFRRWVIITFPFTFKDAPDPKNPNEKKVDKTILSKITTEDELSGFLNLCLEKLDKLLENGFSYSKTTEETREEYIRKSDPIGAFVNDCLKEDEESFELVDNVYNAYLRFCKKHKYPVENKIVFSRNIRKHLTIVEFRPTIGNERPRAWRNIKIINDNDDEPENNKIIAKNMDIPDILDENSNTKVEHVQDAPVDVQDASGMRPGCLHDYVQDVQHFDNYYFKTNKPIRERLTELYKSLGSRKVPVDILKQHFTDEEIGKMLENGDIFEPSKGLFILVNYDEVELA